MHFVFTVVTFSIIGALRARQPDIDINRIRLLPREGYHSKPPNFHTRHSVINHISRNDNDNHSSRLTELRPPVHVLHDTSSNTKEKTNKVYKPREDPRFFYQSDSYIEETNRKNLNNEVSSVYLGRGVIRANDDSRFWPNRLENIESNNINTETCVRCPNDRTLIANVGADRVYLEHPRLLTCSGKNTPQGIRFQRTYGPKFGKLLKQGSHMIVGRINYGDKILQTCKMQIHVLLQSCPVPKYLISHCDAENITCNFTCRDPKHEFIGQHSLTCDQDMKWSGQLPECYVRTWCPLPSRPKHGKVTCNGTTAFNGKGLTEGTSCRIKCQNGWRLRTQDIITCHRGNWTHELSCHPKRPTHVYGHKYFKIGL